jgi:addiction module RelE/StbE family toxin
MYLIIISKKVEDKIKFLNTKDKLKFKKILEQMEQNPFYPTLKSHKLSGNMSNLWSCSLNYKNRIIFFFVKEKEIYLIDIGSHDKVY